jgi:cysteine synthase A
MKPMNEGILSAIGDTPLVSLHHVPDISFRLYAKLEALNPGGSIKDRTAVSIIKHGLETEKIGPNTVVIESSSGNMGIGWRKPARFTDCALFASLTRKPHRRTLAFFVLTGQK